MPDETVSIVVPTYERWDTIGPTLHGALRQAGVEVEVIIVDDGTTPMPDALLDGTGGRVRHIRPPVRRGVGHARNVGVEAAEGSWIAFLDDDDLWAPDKLERQLEACRSAGRDWGFSSGVYVDAELTPFELLRAPSGDGLQEALMVAQVIPGACSNVVVRRDLVRATEGFDPRLHQLADWDLWIRMAERAPAASIDDVLVAYVQHEGSMLVTHRDPILREYALLTRKHRARAERLGAPMDPKLFGFWVAGRLAKAGQRRRAVLAALEAGLRLRQPALVRYGLFLAAGRDGRAAATPAPVPRPSWLDDYEPVPVPEG